jgi:CheY-like chemotaxis protein
MDRLRELRGPDTRERDLANVLGFEHSRAVRWKEGQMYVDRAEYLVRLADALDVEPMLLVNLATGSIVAEQAQRQLANANRNNEDAKKRRPMKTEPIEVATDASVFALDPARFENGGRGVVLLLAANGEGRKALADALARHPELSGLVATSLPVGLVLAERYRPEIAFLDLGIANMQAFDACRALSGLASRAGRRCRVVAGTSTLTDTIEKSALMAGAASVSLYPFAAGVFETELDRLEERLGARKITKRG